MYFRLKNKLDLEILEPELKSLVSSDIVIDRVNDVLDIYDTSYMPNRTPNDMGGYVLLFTDEQQYKDSIQKIYDLHNIDSDSFEYSDVIVKDNRNVWKEELFLYATETSIVIIHPVQKEKDL